MPSITINEKDYTVYNKTLDSDNIVFVPGFTIKGPYDAPVLLTSYADLINTFGSIPTTEQYASGASDASYKRCTSWEYAAQLLNQGFYVLFQRIVPYTSAGAIDTDKLKFANVEFKNGSTASLIKIREKTGGTYGNNLKISFTLNTAKNKLFLKVYDVNSNTVLEYIKMTDVTYNSTNYTIDSRYLLTFAKDLYEAIDSSEYIELVDDTTRTISALNTYIYNIISDTDVNPESVGSFTIPTGENYIVFTPATGVTTFAAGNASHINIIDTVLINPTVGSTVVTTAERSAWYLGVAVATETNYAIEIGRDYTINDIKDDDDIKALCAQLDGYLYTISDNLLYDVKFITKGALTYDAEDLALATTVVSKITGEAGASFNNIAANFCSQRGDCFAVLEPGIDTLSVNTQSEFTGDVEGYASSYSAAYAPWQVFTIFNGYQRWCPPSLVFLNSLAKSVYLGNAVYLPPAGVNRASVPEVVKPRYEVGSKILQEWQNKNNLSNINPIMKLNEYGYVIFGQRTLYDVSDAVTSYRSALQEVGVRLTTIEIKKMIRKVAMRLIFEYNNIHTWNEFKAGIEPLLTQMVQNGALQRYKVIMDGTTTSTDDIDDNIIRGTVKIVPGRAAEDFVISFELYRSAVKFDDEEEVNGY